MTQMPTLARQDQSNTHPVTLSTVIVNWNTADLLKRCLDALNRAAGSFTHEMIVIDNGSIDGSPEMVQSKYPGVRLLRSEQNLGFARANNLGLRIARGHFVLLLNSDTEVQTGALDHMIGFAEVHTDVGIVGASLRNPDGSAQFSCDLFPLSPRQMIWQHLVNVFRPHNHVTRQGTIVRWTYTAPFEVDWVSGAALMIRQEVIHQIGPLDERFFMYAEEIDWCYRAKLAGWRIYHLPQAEILHSKQGSSSGNPLLSAQLLRQRDHSLELFYRKHYGWSAAVGVELIHICQRHILKK